ncbi:hypothetical protein LAZ67_3002362, partial [Cordylochernes scorpioides]
MATNFIRAESPSKAEQKPVRHGLKAQPCAEISAKQDLQNKNPIVLTKNQNYANLPAGSKDANSAAPVDLAAFPTSNAAAQVRRNWADITEEVNPGAEEGFTLVQGRKRRRGSANSPTAAAPFSNPGGSRTIRRPQPSAHSVPRAQEIPTTRAHIAEARARQASSAEEHCVNLEHGPELQPFHYLRALDRLLGGTAGVVQVSKMPRAGRTTAPGPATPTSPTSVPPATAPRLPQQPSAQPPPPASPSPTMEVSDVPPTSRAALHPPAALLQSPPAPSALPAEDAPPAPPPVTPALSLRTPGSREPAAPTPDVEMSIVEETFASSTSSAKNATRVDLDAFIEKHPSVSFAGTDALGLGREEVLDLLSSRTKTQKKGPLLSPPQCDALAGLIRQILNLRPGAASNLYKVLGQVKAELRTTPAAVPPTPPLPAPRPAEPMLPTTHREELTPPLMTPPPPAPTDMEEDDPITEEERCAPPPPAPRLAGPIPPVPHGDTTTPAMTTPPPPLSLDRRWKMAGDLIHELSREIDLEHTFQSQVDMDDIVRAVLYPGDREPFITRLPTRDRYILSGFINTAIWRARDGDPSMLEMIAFTVSKPHVYNRPCGHASRELLSFSPLASGGMSLEATNLVWAGSPHRAEHEPARLGSESEAVADLSAENHFQGEDSRMADASANYANLPIDRSHANFAAACIADVTPSTSGALAAATNWAEQMEAAESGEDSFTVVKHKRRRRESPNRPVEQRSSGVAASRRTGATPRRRPTAGGATVVQEIRATRADIADARVQQRSSTEDNCVFVEHCPDFGYTHYLQAVEELVGGGNVLQVMEMDGHMLVGLSTKALAERLLRDVLEIGHTHLRAFPFKKRAERITVANLPFFVDDAAVIEALRPYGDVTSIVPIRLRAGRYTFTDGRREVFILLKEGFTLEKIPNRVVIRNKGNVLSAFISYGVKCSRCGRQGHRRANCPINPGRASNNGQPQPAPLPPGASSTVSRQQSRPTPAAPALPMEESPSAPPPVTPAPPLQAPEGPLGPRPAGSQHPEPPPARLDLVAPRGPLPAQKTLGPAAPTPDVEMSIVEETFESSTSSAKNATIVDLDAFIEGHPSVSFAETDALGLGREEVLDLLSSRTKAQRKGPLLSPPQCDALVGLIGQILDLRPGAASNLYKVLGQVKAELRTTPAVPPTPPLPAPQPAKPVPPAPHKKKSTPARTTPPLPLPDPMEEKDLMPEVGIIFRKMIFDPGAGPFLESGIQLDDIMPAVLYSEDREELLEQLSPENKSVLAGFLDVVLEYTLNNHPTVHKEIYGLRRLSIDSGGGGVVMAGVVVSPWGTGGIGPASRGAGGGGAQRSSSVIGSSSYMSVGAGGGGVIKGGVSSSLWVVGSIGSAGRGAGSGGVGGTAGVVLSSALTCPRTLYRLLAAPGLRSRICPIRPTRASHCGGDRRGPFLCALVLEERRSRTSSRPRPRASVLAKDTLGCPSMNASRSTLVAFFADDVEDAKVSSTMGISTSGVGAAGSRLPSVRRDGAGVTGGGAGGVSSIGKAGAAGGDGRGADEWSAARATGGALQTSMAGLEGGRKRRRGSANSPTAAAPSSNAGGSRTIRRPQPSAGSVPRAQEIRVTRAHIAEARARQASSSEEHCVYIEHSPELEPFHYLRALDRMLGGTAGVIQITKVNGHQLLGLTNRGLAERLISEGLEVEGTLLRAFPFRKRAERITVGNLPFFIGDSTVINALSPYGRVTSIAPKQMKAGPYVYVDGRRDVFITLHEGITIERLPTRLDINIKGEAWPAYLSSGIRCSRCHGQGHRRAICPLLAGLANNTRMAPPTTPAGVPPPTTPAPPQRSAAQPPAPTPSNPAMEVCSAPPVARAALHSSAPRPSPPASPAYPMEETPPAPPPVTPALSLRTPGSREPAAPTPDVEMSIVEETFASSTSSAKNATRVDLDAFIEKHPSVSFAGTDALGLGREEVLDLPSSRTKTQRKRPLLSPPQCDALAGLIRQILNLKPGAASNLYKVLGQVKAELRTTPAAVPPTPPLPAPRPAEPMLPTTHREELTPPLMKPPPPAPTDMEEDDPITEEERCAPPSPAPRLAGPIPPVPHGDTTTPAMTTPPPPLSLDRRWKMTGDLIHELSREIDLEHTFQSQVDMDDIVRAVLYPGDREPFIKRLPTRDRYILSGFINTVIWRARDGDPSMLE